MATSKPKKKKAVEKVVPKMDRVPEDAPEPPVNRYKPWMEWQLEEILRCVPTKENTESWARIFERGSGGIALVYRWAYTRDKDIQGMLDAGDNRGDFALRVRRIAKKLGIII